MARATLANLLEEIASLKETISFLERRLDAVGVPTERFISPNKVAALLDVSRPVIMKEIRAAEYARQNHLPCDLKWGIHYRRDTSEWKVCDRAFKATVLDVPPEERTYVDVPNWFKL